MKVKIGRKCSITKEDYIVEVDKDSWEKYKSGGSVKNVFPYLSADEREFLISGTTPAEWNAWFGEEDEE